MLNQVKPSILHGDLWSGNIGAVDGEPSIFDPASYYGHHEAEFGISWCAGFGQVMRMMTLPPLSSFSLLALLAYSPSK